jgi:hypothetical protein
MMFVFDIEVHIDHEKITVDIKFWVLAYTKVFESSYIWMKLLLVFRFLNTLVEASV